MASLDFLAGGGEMGAMMRAKDWAQTALGPVEAWPQSLRTTVSTMLSSRFPMFLWWGPELAALYNDAYRVILGDKHPRSLGASGRQTWAEIWDVIGPMVDHVLATGEATWSENQRLLLARHGFVEETYFTFSYSPLRDESSAIVGVYATVAETTRQVLGERRLRTLGELAARTADATDVGDACRLAAAVLAETPADLPHARIELDLDAPAHEGELAFVSGSIKLFVVPSEHLRPEEGYHAFLELLATHVAAAIGRVRALQQARERAEALAELDRTKTAFFSNVSHEFRTPLTLMLGPLEQALAGGTGLHGPDLQTAHRNAQRLLKLVNTLLEFSRIEAGRTQARFEPLELATLTGDAASAFRAAIESAGLTFTVDSAPLGEPVFVDRDLWEKVVLNLVSNAYKFTFEGGIAVAVRREGNRAVLEVRDTGTGIAADQLPRVFERFHRVEGARSRSHEGSGIGLALVRELVRMHGGELDIASELGRGTTFTIRLPFGSAHLPPDRIGAPQGAVSSASTAYVEEAMRWTPALGPAADAAQGRARVLVVDDNADMREYFARLLQEHWHVELAGDGVEALERARAHPPDLILSDVMMPRLDGYGLLRAVRADPVLRTTPVIMVSARAGEDARVEGLVAGADDYLTKPFSANELIARVKNQIALRSLQQRLATQRIALANLFERTPVPIAIMRGPDLIFELANEAYCQVAGRQVIGKAFIDALPEIRGQGWDELLLSVMRTGEPHVGRETLVRLQRDGKLVDTYFTFVYAPLRDEHGDGVIAICNEVTEEVTARARLEALANEASAANRAKDEFLAMLGHELRNPLAPMVTALELMRLRNEQTTREEQVLDRQVHHLSRLVDDLLDVSRITSRRIELRKRRVELVDVVAQGLEVASPLLEQRQNKVEVDVARTGLAVDADPDRLAQVIGNLLTNAAKYSNPATRITVSAQRAGDVVRLAVKDEGVGIAPEMIDRVFDLFVQQRQTLARSQGGLGLGLAIARSLVELHGGSIAASSEGVNKGSEFVVELPAADGTHARVHSGEPGSLAKRILVVDDNEDALTVMRALLEEVGCTVEIALDGPTALDKARAFRPDIALLDLGLPVMDGYELARRLRELDAIRLVAVTGYGQDSDRSRTRAAGFADHVVKPVDIAKLVALVRAL